MLNCDGDLPGPVLPQPTFVDAVPRDPHTAKTDRVALRPIPPGG